ncbi:hypothetical protein ACQP25_22895 [Microtetraspora malaysiensis]
MIEEFNDVIATARASIDPEERAKVRYPLRYGFEAVAAAAKQAGLTTI